AAATFGRGLWTQTALSILPLNNFSLRGRWTGNTAELTWNNQSLPAGSTFEIESSTDAINYRKIGTVSKSVASSYSYNDIPFTVKNIFYRIKSIEQTGATKYSNIVRLSKNNSANGTLEITKLYPNPVKDLMNIGFNVPQKGMATYTVTAMNGQTIWKKQEKLEFSGNYSITEYVSTLKPGNYVFTILLNGQKSSLPFIKK
ncbi:MAG: T9SS type A sorting domain-containing protein, partial [Ferruginibacter sp.]